MHWPHNDAVAILLERTSYQLQRPKFGKSGSSELRWVSCIGWACVHSGVTLDPIRSSTWCRDVESAAAEFFDAHARTALRILEGNPPGHSAVPGAQGAQDPFASELCQLAYVHARARNERAGALFAAIAEAVLPWLHDLAPQKCASLVWCFASTGHTAPRLFAAVAQCPVWGRDDDGRAPLRPCRYDPQQLATLAWSYATNAHAAPALFDDLAAAALQRVRSFSCQGLSRLAWAYATARHPAAQLLEAVATAAPRVLPEGSTWGLRMLAWALCTAEQTDVARSLLPPRDALDGGGAARALGLDALRADALARCEGDVLELAVGTGLNLRAYDANRVKTYTAIDLSPGMLARAKARAETLALGEKARFEEADATALPFDDGSFDVVVDTFSLCVIEDPSAALREVRRVLRSKGRAVLIEHSKSDVGALGAYQDLTSAPVKRMSKGCVWNQDVESLVRQSGMRVVKTQRALLGLLVVVEAAP